MRDLARRLVAVSQTVPGSHVDEALVVVIEKLRIALTKFAGREGFTSLLQRALVLAGADVPSLQCVKVGVDGHLEGIEQSVTDDGTAVTGSEAAIAITTQLLGLLVTFVGGSLTLRLVGAAWPDISLDREYSSIKANP